MSKEWARPNQLVRSPMLEIITLQRMIIENVVPPDVPRLEGVGEAPHGAYPIVRELYIIARGMFFCGSIASAVKHETSSNVGYCDDSLEMMD